LNECCRSIWRCFLGWENETEQAMDRHVDPDNLYPFLTAIILSWNGPPTLAWKQPLLGACAENPSPPGGSWNKAPNCIILDIIPKGQKKIKLQRRCTYITILGWWRGGVIRTELPITPSNTRTANNSIQYCSLIYQLRTCNFFNCYVERVC